MSGIRYDIQDIITGDTLYVDGNLACKDFEFTLPGLDRKTVAYDNLGFEEVIPGRFDASNLQLHKIGLDSDLYRIGSGGTHEYILRFALIAHNGEETYDVGGYCYVKGRSKGIPEVGANINESIDTTLEIIPTVYRLVIDGHTYIDIDKLSGKCVIWGVDERRNIDAFL